MEMYCEYKLTVNSSDLQGSDATDTKIEAFEDRLKEFLAKETELSAGLFEFVLEEE